MNSHLTVWENYKQHGDQRSWLVAEIIGQHIDIKNKTILDFGCGEGNTAQYFSNLGANVTAVDIRAELIEKFKDTKIQFFTAESENSYFQHENYDAVILQDVLEHVQDPELILNKVHFSLKKDGLVYISTPNRLSPLNFFSDPHWNLPFVSIFSRRGVEFLVKHIFKRDKRERSDWAALLSLWKLRKILKREQFRLMFVNRKVAEIMFDNPWAVVCHPKHVQIIGLINKYHLQKFFIKLVNDKFGIFNYLLNPTWYIFGKKL